MGFERVNTPFDGPINAKVMVVGEAPGLEEIRIGRPFVGASGWELDKMLGEAGVSRSAVRVTNVCNYRPPDNDITNFVARSNRKEPTFVRLRDMFVSPLLKEGYVELITELERVSPSMVIALGNVSTWALTGKWGITNWRGSMLEVDTEEMRRWL